MADREDELARTATGPRSVRDAPSEPIEKLVTLGRYRIERELGTGGMGVVHAAFDPDLERRVALKVLLTERAGATSESRQRLLREARAMARLAHPNVVTVHEVGSANGRDYVAMELVDGETLADWLREPGTRHEPAAIIAAFLAAARGLAAAHAAGIVHRDFKPHNVLRDRATGRVAVTDFGLAREASELALDPFAQTMQQPPPAAAQAGGTSPLSGLTATGSVLGTPAYMAPEQWRGGAVTPASDQFAYCVALWEALTGVRPFSGMTLDELRSNIERGPAALDAAAGASRIPRPLRAALRRGLEPDPKRRHPSMDALIDAMTALDGAARRSWLPVAVLAGVAGLAVLLALVLGIGTRGSSAPAVLACPAAGIDPQTITAITAMPGRAIELRAIAGDLAAWNQARDEACADVTAPARAARLACLDGVLVRLRDVAQAVQQLPRALPAMDAGAFLIDPHVCAREPAPRLTTVSTGTSTRAMAAAVREQATPGPADLEAGKALVVEVAAEPCAAAIARMTIDAEVSSAERDAFIAALEQDADRCDDQRIRADVALVVARHALRTTYLNTAMGAKLRLAETSVKRVEQPDLVAALDILRMRIALRGSNLDEAVLRGDAAAAGFEQRNRLEAQIAAGIATLDVLGLRAGPGDLERVQRQPLAWRALAVARLGASHPVVRTIDAAIAGHQFAVDPGGAHHALARLRTPEPQERPRRIRGRVIDGARTPIAGATVTVGPFLTGTTAGAAVAFDNVAGQMRVVETDAHGAFDVPDAPDDGVVIAERGDARSQPLAIADEVELVLEPTTRIQGVVDLRGEPAVRALIMVMDERVPMGIRYQLVAPVAPDGSFSLAGVPRAPVQITAAVRRGVMPTMSWTSVDARRPVSGLRLAVVTDARQVHVLVRSLVGAPVGNAQVMLFANQQRASSTLDKLARESPRAIELARQLELEKAPPVVMQHAKPGDLWATLRGVPDGATSACAIGLPSDISDARLDRKIRDNLAKIDVRCVPVERASEVVVIDVPPWPRLD